MLLGADLPSFDLIILIVAALIAGIKKLVDFLGKLRERSRERERREEAATRLEFEPHPADQPKPGQRPEWQRELSRQGVPVPQREMEWEPEPPPGLPPREEEAPPPLPAPVAPAPAVVRAPVPPRVQVVSIGRLRLDRTRARDGVVWAEVLGPPLGLR